MLLIGLSELKGEFVHNSFSVVLRNSKQNENLLSEVHGSCILIIFYQVGFVSTKSYLKTLMAAALLNGFQVSHVTPSVRAIRLSQPCSR